MAIFDASRGTLLAQTKTAAWRALKALPGTDFHAACHQHLSADCEWTISHPINHLVGPQAVADVFY